jgi:5,6-dimethylbenzimidazole synthase
VDNAPEFNPEFRERLRDLLKWRRDVRGFKRTKLPEGTIERLIAIACLAPSVGLSEPWRFVIVEGEGRRAAIRQCFEDCNRAALDMQAPDRAALYARLKLAGLDDAPCQLAVFADRSTAQGGKLGRLTMPETLDYSVVIAIHTLWLAARAEGLGVGWVSLFDVDAVRRLLQMPADAKPVAILCIGHVERFYEEPMLQAEGWAKRVPQALCVDENRWPASIQS